MSMKDEKLKPVRDILSEVLDEVEPTLSFLIGDTLFECWKPDHITEAHNLRFVNAQVELMVLGRQYVAITEELNELSNKAEISTEERVRINELSQGMSDKIKEMLPLNVTYIESLTETKPGEFLKIIKKDLEKRSPKKELPLALFVNKFVEQMRKALEETNKEDELEEMGKQVLLKEPPQKNLPEAEQTLILEAA
jgi:hypothetical protein